MKTQLHDAANWAPMDLREYGNTVPCIACKHAPVDKDGTMYPPIPWSTLTKAYGAVERSLSCKLPQVWTKHPVDHRRVLGVLWEINARWQNEEYYEGYEVVRELVCATHEHLGPLYDTFIEAK